MTGSKGGSRGVFITFEGVEGAGKSTQIALVAQALRDRGYTVCLTREPGGEPLAEKIRQLLLDSTDDPPTPRTELLLMQAARAQHVDRLIRPHLEAGEVVICDRFYHSTIAYQGFARGLDTEFIQRSTDFAVDSVHPTVTLVLDIPPEEGLLRQSKRNRMESEDIGFHQRVREGFLEQVKALPATVKLVDAHGSVEEVHQRVMCVLEPILKIPGD
ncbi:MAG: dTMP kinase [Armatimonadetes bacterium]|nr:dTMP kinase [Armatimonadota bacterium]